jgi:hypothetical protein
LNVTFEQEFYCPPQIKINTPLGNGIEDKDNKKKSNNDKRICKQLKTLDTLILLSGMLWNNTSLKGG